MLVNILSIASIALLITIIIMVFIQNPKKFDSKMLWFYISVFIIGFVLHFYAVEVTKDYPIYYGLTYAFVASIKMFAFSIEDILLGELVIESTLYAIAITLLYLVASFATVLLVILLFGKQLKNWFKINRLKGKMHYIVIGSTTNAQNFAKKLAKQSIIIVDRQEAELYKSLISEDIMAIKGSITLKTLTRAGAFNHQENRIIVLQDDLTNLEIALKLEQMQLEHTQIYINYEEDEKTNAFGIKNRSKGQIDLFSINELTIQMFMLEHGILEEAKVPMKRIKAFMLGFGTINKKMIKHLMINSQMGDISFSSAVFDYSEHIDAKIEEQRFMNYHYGLWELDHLDQQKYYPFPTAPRSSQINFYHSDIMSYQFKQQLSTLMDEYNCLFIALGNDKLNFETALDLNHYLQVHSVNNYRIYVFIKDSSLYDLDNLFDDHIVAYGAEKEVLTSKVIIDQQLDTIAKRINGLYWGINLDDQAKLQTLWDECNYFEKDSNRYVAYHLKTKLNLMGLTITQKQTTPVTEAEYQTLLARYREQLAIIEHNRWNAFYIMNNHLPMPKATLSFDVSKQRIIRKDQVLKLHACLTTYEGLKELTSDSQELVPSTINAMDRARIVDVFASDFLVMDHLFAVLAGLDYQITFRK